METLSKIDAPSSETKNLRTFYIKCEANIRGLETLGVATESYDSLLIPILLKDNIRCLIFRTDPLADSSLDRLRAALQQEIETRKKSSMFLLEDSNPAMEEEVFIPTAGALLSSAHRKHRTQNNSPLTPISNLRLHLPLQVFVTCHASVGSVKNTLIL